VTLLGDSTLANTGTISAARAPGDPSALLGTVTIDGEGQFANDGLIDVSAGRFDLHAPTPLPNQGRIVVHSRGSANILFGNYGTTRQFVNTGSIEADVESTIRIAAPTQSGVHWGEVVNDGLIRAAGGSIEIDAPLSQDAGGRVVVADGGVVRLDDSSDGGSIEIQGGMLAFGGSSGATSVSAAARGFHSDLIFSGSTGLLNFSAGQASIQEVFRGIDATSAELTVFTADNQPLADIHLTGGHYTADEFQVSGAIINFIDHPA
jgi:hypothetical protein